MKRNPCYKLTRIANVWYLLPVGQMIADHNHGIQLNETGIYLWNVLEEDRTFKELVELCAEHYQLDSENLSQLNKDIGQFITLLISRGIILSDDSFVLGRNTFSKCLKIGNLICRIYGPTEAFSHKFDAFLCDNTDNPNQKIEIIEGAPKLKENGTLLLRNSEVTIIECENKYILLFPTFEQIEEVHLNKDGALARFYCFPPFTEVLRDNIFHAIRPVFLYLAQKHGMAAIHSASILYREKAWLFSGPSGTGKSTHTNLWHTLANTPLLNGDLNLLAIENDIPVIHGIPWCGTSGICDTMTYPLGGIILLKQSTENLIEQLSEDKKRLFVTQRLISPSWTENLVLHNLSLVDTIVDDIVVCRLFCTPDIVAVKLIQKKIDEYLNK